MPEVAPEKRRRVGIRGSRIRGGVLSKAGVLVAVAGVAGVIGGVFAPTSVRSVMDRVLPIAAAVAVVYAAGLAVLASRLERQNVSSFEKRLRRVLFVERR
jgi:hypothetical protein